MRMIAAVHSELGERRLCVEGDVPLLFTENETNNQLTLAWHLLLQGKDTRGHFLVLDTVKAGEPLLAGKRAGQGARIAFEQFPLAGLLACVSEEFPPPSHQGTTKQQRTRFLRLRWWHQPLQNRQRNR